MLAVLFGPQSIYVNRGLAGGGKGTNEEKRPCKGHWRLESNIAIVTLNSLTTCGREKGRRLSTLLPALKMVSSVHLQMRCGRFRRHIVPTIINFVGWD